MIRVLLADDHALVREGLRRILSEMRDVDVVAEAANGPDALTQARATRPHVVLLDVSMPGRGGIETLQELKRLRPPPRVLILSMHPEDQLGPRFFQAGADGYMTKESAPAELIAAVRKVHGGGKYVSAALAERLALGMGRDFTRPPHEGLSHREFQVLCAIGGGATATEIAKQLHLSVKTVSTYRARLLEKMGARNNAELMRYAVGHALSIAVE
jgi:two-component system, NarL family, invasion response regulator UvrY